MIVTYLENRFRDPEDLLSGEFRLVFPILILKIGLEIISNLSNSSYNYCVLQSQFRYCALQTHDVIRRLIVFFNLFFGKHIEQYIDISFLNPNKTLTVPL